MAAIRYYEKAIEIEPDYAKAHAGIGSTIPAFSMGKYGVYGESAVVPENAVAQYPRNLSAIEGSAIWMQYITVFGALLEYGKLKKDDSVLITAAASTTGLAAIQIAKATGALVSQ